MKQKVASKIVFRGVAELLLTRSSVVPCWIMLIVYQKHRMKYSTGISCAFKTYVFRGTQSIETQTHLQPLTKPRQITHTHMEIEENVHGCGHTQDLNKIFLE